jgi:predicted phage tail protein
LTWLPVSGATGVRIERCSGVACTAFIQVAQLSGVLTYTSTGLTPGSVYRYRLRAYNSGGQTAYSSVAEATVPPSPPGYLAVTTVSGNALLLRWSDTNGESGFRIERCPGAACSTFAEVGQVVANMLTLTDSSLQSASLYRYRVRSFNAAGSSGPSIIGQATTLPAPPSNLSAAAVSASQINLVWANPAGSTGTRIERCAGANCATFTAIAQVVAGVASFADRSLVRGVTYRYRVRAVNSAGPSLPSGIALATTP